MPLLGEGAAPRAAAGPAPPHSAHPAPAPPPRRRARAICEEPADLRQLLGQPGAARSLPPAPLLPQHAPAARAEGGGPPAAAGCPGINPVTPRRAPRTAPTRGRTAPEGSVPPVQRPPAGASPRPPHLLQVCKGDGVAGEHLVGLVGQRGQQRELLPVRQVVAQHGQARAAGGEGLTHTSPPTSARRFEAPQLMASRAGVGARPPSLPRGHLSRGSDRIQAPAACPQPPLRGGASTVWGTRGRRPQDRALPPVGSGSARREAGSGAEHPEGLQPPPRGHGAGSHLYCLALSMYSCCSMPWESAADTSMMLLRRHGTASARPKPPQVPAAPPAPPAQGTRHEANGSGPLRGRTPEPAADRSAPGAAACPEGTPRDVLPTAGPRPQAELGLRAPRQGLPLDFSLSGLQTHR